VPPTSLPLESLKQRLKRLNLHGLLACIDELATEPWLSQVLEIEESERLRRSFKRRLDEARLGAFKPMADFDYSWPKELDRTLLDEIFTFSFLEQAANVVIVGPHGLGKTMIIKNLLHQTVLRGGTARFTAASDMLHDLASQDSSTLLSRRLQRYITPTVLGVDEVGYLAYDSRYADLLFEVVTRRYQLRRPVVVTTNKAFKEWSQVFPNATSVVALVDRLVHRSEILKIDGESYRLKEAQERAAQRAEARAASKKARKAANNHAAQ
jgi:DNA replication protein DnaC